jgi:glycosyltransferase involved in cell wall biosynthesis
MCKETLISIITVCFNNSKTILDTIESVNSQSYSNIEHIFIDGASNDNTVEIIKNSAKRNYIIISEKDNGIYHAMNKGLKVSKGEIIGFLNADDLFFTNQTVDLIIKSFSTNIDCVYGNLLFFNSQNKVVRKWASREFKKIVYEKLGYYREDLSIASDVDLMFRFLEIHRIQSYYLNEKLIKMRLGGASTRSLKSTLTITKEVLRIFREHGFEYSKTVYVLSKVFKAIKQINSFGYFSR